MNTSPTARRGAHHEQRALRYLCDRGLTLEAQNFRGPRGEIDLIMRDGAVTVFIEVRYRRDTRYGGAAASIDRRKRERIAATALHYLQQRDGECSVPMRFDVIAIEGPRATLSWLRNALEF